MTFLQTFGRFAGQSFKNPVSLSALFALRQQRLALRRLSDAELQDIGFTREEALREAKRPLWDVPNYWHK